MEQKIIARLKAALGIAQMAMEQGKLLSDRVAINGPTVSEVINSAIVFAEEHKTSVLQTASIALQVKSVNSNRYYSEGYLLWELAPNGEYELAGIINSEGHTINLLTDLGTDEEEAIRFVESGEVLNSVIDLNWKISASKNE